MAHGVDAKKAFARKGTGRPAGRSLSGTETRLPAPTRDVRQLGHELKAHQIKLERQNEELRRLQLALHASEKELAAVYDTTPVIMLLVDADGRIYKTNKFAENFARSATSQQVPLRPGEVLGCAFALQNPQGCGSGQHCRNCTILSIARATVKTGRNYQRVRANLMLSRHGKLQPVIMLLSSTRISFQGKAHALIMIEDITERKQVEERVVQLNRVRAFLGGVDHAIVHNPDQKKLLDEICRVAVEKGGFKLAWVGFVMPNGIVQPVAKAGVTGYLKDIRVVARKVPEGSGPVGLAIRENRAVISDDIDHDARMAPWHARARQFGLHYCAAFPIRIADKVIGTITLYAPRAGFFDEGEVNLLTMVSDEISFALTAFDVALKRKLAVEALLLSEKELADFFGRSPLGLLWVGPDGRIQRINQAELRLLGRSKKETLGLPIAQFHADPKAIANLLNRLATGATVKDYRTRIRQKDGKIKHVLIDANGLWVNKTLKHSRWFVWDISRRVELEKEILTIGERIQRELGRELHDDLGQQLTSIEFLSQSLAGDLAAQSGNDAARAREIARLVRQTILKTRELSHGLSPVGLETENGLMNTLRALAESIRRIYKIECYFRCSKPVRSLSHTTNIQLFRIAQEAVTNAIKHGKARRIDISLAGSDSKIIIAVKNDGTPLPKNAFARKGIGLHLMQYRAGIIGGSASVQLEPNGRTSAVCIVPASHQIEIERDGE